MEKRKEINDKIIAWIINKVKTEYADDISLVLIYGSFINGTAHSKSDVDCYYIPKTERGYRLAIDFIIDGVGYDIFPISWERAAGIADLQENLSPLIGDVQILYCSGSDDLERFKTLQERLKRNLSDEKYVRDIAVKRWEQADKICALMKISHRSSDIRKLAGAAVMTLADAVAVYHHDYFHFGLKKQFDDLRNHFPDAPQNIAEEYKNVTEADDMDDVIEHTLKMLREVGRHLNITTAGQQAPLQKAAKEKDEKEGEIAEAREASKEGEAAEREEAVAGKKIDGPWLAGLYEEISSTFQKIYVCCEKGNYILAFLSAVCLQNELDEAGEAGCPYYDLLGAYKYTDLGLLSAKTREIESDFVQLITENGGCIKRFDSFEQFEEAGL